MVRKLLMSAAAGQVLAGEALCSRLFVPKTFQVQRREANIKRLGVQWELTKQRHPDAHPLLLLVGELKEIKRADGGARAFVKHLPQLPLLLGDALYAHLLRRFGAQLYRSTNAADARMVTVATFMLDDGVARVHEISLMPALADWIPVADRFERRLVAELVLEGRHFRKRLPLHDGLTGRSPTVDLLDTVGRVVPLFIARSRVERNEPNQLDSPRWMWRAREAAMPSLPVCRNIRRSAGWRDGGKSQFVTSAIRYVANTHGAPASSARRASTGPDGDT